MARRKSVPVREPLRKLFPRARILRAAREHGVVRRFRKVDIVEFFWVLVLGFGLGRERTISGLRHSFIKATGVRIVQSAFYDRFTEALVKMLRQLAGEAVAALQEFPKALEGPLESFSDLVWTDATVIKLNDMLASSYRGCGKVKNKAALKLHAVISAKGAGKNSIKVTSQRKHEGPVFHVGRWVTGKLLLFDLGFFRYQLFASITRNGGYFVSRLKRNTNPEIVAVNHRHRGRAIDLVGVGVWDLLDELDREFVDVTVSVAFRRRRYDGRKHGSRATQLLRVVGARCPKTKRFQLYVTNVPTDKLNANDIALVYRARWMVELVFRELKTNYRMKDMPSSKKRIVDALLYSAILTLAASRRLLHELRQKLASSKRRVPNERWARLLENVSQELLVLMVRPPRETRAEQRRIAVLLLAEAQDPNIKRRGLMESVETRDVGRWAKAA